MSVKLSNNIQNNVDLLSSTNIIMSCKKNHYGVYLFSMLKTRGAKCFLCGGSLSFLVSHSGDFDQKKWLLKSKKEDLTDFEGNSFCFIYIRL